MKIGPQTAGVQTDATAQSAAPARTADAAAAQRAAGPHGAEGSAKVELSSTAATLLAGTDGASADFDAGKVERISQAIANGTFKVDAEAIADKLIANAEEVLRSGRAGPAGG